MQLREQVTVMTPHGFQQGVIVGRTLFHIPPLYDVRVDKDKTLFNVAEQYIYEA